MSINPLNTKFLRMSTVGYIVDPRHDHSAAALDRPDNLQKLIETLSREDRALSPEMFFLQHRHHDERLVPTLTSQALADETLNREPFRLV